MNSFLKIAGVATFGISVLFAVSCKKTSSGAVDNPYSNVDTSKGNTGNNDKIPDPASIEGLHKNLFKPTCANSGCHDGTFEPDFRTVQSSYASLVNVKPIKNDQAGTFNARVLPGSDAASILIYRMTEDLGGNSGIMPLVLDPGSDYEAKKSEHLKNVRKWINDGAKDFNGNPPVNVDFPPTILGVQGLVSGSSIGRGGKYEAMYMSPGPNVELWFSLADDKLDQSNLSNMKINWSTDPTKYDPQNEKSLIKGTKKSLPGIYAGTTDYVWYYSFPTAGLQKDDVIWFRITMSDGTNQDYTLPNDNSMFFLKKYFALRIL